MPPSASSEGKAVEWMGSSRKDIRECPDGVKDALGYAHHLAQHGSTHPNAKPMKGALREVMEVAADEDRATYRGMYTVKLAGVVYVLHVFKKKSTQGIKTAKRELDVIAKRLAAARDHYQQHYASRPADP